ncbi:cation transporter [Candidatus Woesearchaeota archaeon]|nr:cation transporter [Candidatus Woesearchaeota archaeon]
MDERIKKIQHASIFATVGNALLAVLKIVSGFVFGSLALLGDGLDTATDIITSSVALITTKIMEKKPNPKYVYGYKRADAVSAKVLSFIIFFAGAQLAYTTVMKFIHNEGLVIPSIYALIVTVISVIGKLILTWNQYSVGKKTNSSMLIANASNMRNDILISLSVMFGIFFTVVLNMPIIDMIIALIVSVFIMKTAFDIFRENKTELMDGVNDPDMYRLVLESVCSVRGVINPHRIRIRKLGDSFVVSLDVEVKGSTTVSKAHALTVKVESKIRSAIPNIYDVRTHVEPIGSCDLSEKYGVDEKILTKYECKRLK